MLRCRRSGDAIRIGPHFRLSFQRTLRIPDDGNTYPLPPSLGSFPIRRIADVASRVPASWRKHGGVFLPMYQREAMWLSFHADSWHPCAVKIAVGKVNAISGEPWSEKLSSQDYVVCPDQPWLDGIKAGEGTIRQFVAMPLGMGYTVEGQVTGKEEFGGLQIKVFAPKPGRFPDQPPHERRSAFSDGMVMYAPLHGSELGLAAGGRMRQKIYPDPHGIGTWDTENTGRVYVHIVNSMTYREITGEEPPATPVTARMYTDYGYPWFELYDEEKGDLEVSETLKRVKSVKEMDAAKGFEPQQDDGTVEVKKEQVKGLGMKDDASVPDGAW